MKYSITATTCFNNEDVLKKYPILNNYDPFIDYPYRNEKVARVVIEVDNITKLFEEIGQPIIIDKDVCEAEHGATYYILEIYDGWRE